MKGRILSGRFRLHQLISRGGMGAIYVARDVHTGDRVAVKILREDAGDHPKVRERFHIEARAARRIDSDFVAKTLASGETPQGELFLVMQFVDGPTLRQTIKRKAPIGCTEGLRISRAIALGLQDAHLQEVIHRDLKPENILCPRKPASAIIKIVDFGIARIMDTPRITTAHHVLGTPSYMSPEQAMGIEADLRSDVYSLGVIMYELFSGVLPYQGRTPEELLRAHLERRPTPINELRPDCPCHPQISELIEACLEKSPARRPQNMSLVLDAMAQVG